MFDGSGTEDLSGRDEKAVLVSTANGDTYEGWIIRDDAVLVGEAGLTLPARVRIGAEEIGVEAVFERSPYLDGPVWSALQLPQGSVSVEGELRPAWVDPMVFGGGDNRGQARRSMWCLLFPRLRGC